MPSNQVHHRNNPRLFTNNAPLLGNNAPLLRNNPPFSRRPSKTFSFPFQKVLEGQVEKTPSRKRNHLLLQQMVS